MPTTFANQINNNPIYADRAEKDAAGNTISSTYATKAELPEGVPTVTSSDDGKVLQASYSGGTGSVSWVTPSGGNNVFLATYNVTTFEEIRTAHNAGKAVFLYNSTSDTLGYLLPLEGIFKSTNSSNSFARFNGILTLDSYGIAGWQLYEVNGNNVWRSPWQSSITSPTSSDIGKFFKATNTGMGAWSALTTSVTDIQQVNALPANPVSTVLYLIPET